MLTNYLLNEIYLKQGTPLCLLLLNACSTSLTSLEGSILQNDPFPGSS